jgi:exodeoxyribonuclease X
MRILVADTETSGLTSTDGICELGFLEIDQDLYVLNEFQSLINPGVPIKPEASAASHIVDSMVADAPTMDEALAGFPEDYFANVLLIAHHSQFDRRFLSKFWNITNEFCTLRAARSCYPAAPNHKLQTLRYYLNLEVEGGSHRAMEDVIATYELLARIIEDSGLSLRDLLEARDRPVRIETMPFGKHKGLALTELPESYIWWLLNKAEIDEDLKWSLEQL